MTNSSRVCSGISNVEPSTASQRIAIVGGGITGLAAAFRLIERARETGREIDLHLFEASDQLGGLIRTREIDGYQVDFGPDSFITNKPAGIGLCRRLNLEHELIGTNKQHQRSLVLHRGRPVAVPDGFMLLAPAKVWPVLRSPIFSPWGKLRMGFEYFVPKRSDDADESLASFVRRRFGRELLDRLVQPLVGGIYTSDPERLSLKATLPRFLDMEQGSRSLIRASRLQSVAKGTSGARYGLFASFQNGCGQLVDELVCQIRGSATIHENTAVRSVFRTAQHEHPLRGRWSLEIAGTDVAVQEFDHVLITTPTYVTAELVRGLSPELASALDQIEYASSAIVCSGHRLADIQHPLDAFGLVIPAIEKRKVLAVSFTSRKFPRAPEGRVLLRTFVGGAMQPELNDLEDAAMLELVRNELQSLLGVKWQPDFALVARHRRAMPQYLVGHLDRVAEIEQQVEKCAGLELAGSAFHGVGIPDSIASAEAAADRIADSHA